MKIEKKISLIWRNENYGSVYRSVAFRADIDPYPSDAAYKRLARIYRKCGFAANESRGAWIAEGCAADTPSRLVAALTEAGYAVEHQGCFASLDEVAARAAELAAPPAAPGKA